MCNELLEKFRKEGYKFEPIPEYGDLMTMQKFIDCCNCGGFIDYDGFGNYAFKDCVATKSWEDEDEEWHTIEVKPSMVKKGTLDMRFTHVVWHNK